ncbi:hypothetical protein Cpin_3833 [Chitinophaga pinensis DSM 2588]|uniref:Uncharacterized protein n=1 Tax=Chitinophaga pinensis (strain ATCC 43595 / DSM 2588 / LMG 13176 / NBRC 15968 / NCIMB 11800 / UQM 2034) TaxID=485918 RepID=A0A979GXN5_CHIPD|nr:hypothetical protein Cpin_3833 [Chitinophaga pinensis DSM 2588]
MPKKGHIAKHEWGYTVSPISTPKYRCCHCECSKIEDGATGRILFMDKADNMLVEEPKCITRQTTEDGQTG